VHKTTDKTTETARTTSRTTQNSAYTAMDYALKAREMNAKFLQQTSQAWIEGFRYQAKLSQGMAQAIFGQWGNALASMPHVALPVRKQSESEITVPATNGSQKSAEMAVKDAPKDIKTEVAAKNVNTATAAKQTQKATETATKGTQKTTELAVKDTQKSAQKAEEAAEETQKATETVAKSAQKNTEPASNGAQKNAETATLPIDGYDDMNVGEVSERLKGLSTDELQRVRKYEKENKDRASLRKEIKQKIETSS
jgi:hypothetical protein